MHPFMCYHLVICTWHHKGLKRCGMGLFNVMYMRYMYITYAPACKGEGTFWNNHILHGACGREKNGSR